MKHAVSLLITLLSVLTLNAAANPKPNILFILTDDQGYGARPHGPL